MGIEDDDSEDEVFENKEELLEDSPAKDENNLQMNDFARDWARSIKRSPFKNEIFRSLTQLSLVESRRDKLISNFEWTLNRLRQNVRHHIRKATREMRLGVLKKFEPELHHLYIIGQGKLIKSNKMNSSNKKNIIGKICSPGRLRDRSKGRSSGDDGVFPLSMTGSGCQLNQIRINEKMILPEISQNNQNVDVQESINNPRIIEMDVKRNTIDSNSLKSTIQ